MKEEEKLQAKNDDSGSNPPVASVVKKRPAYDEHDPSQPNANNRKRQHTDKNKYDI